jgi:hypothetical protein
MLPIEKGIPIPRTKGPNRGQPGAAGEWPIGQMEVDDSFLVPGMTAKQVRNAIYNPAARLRRRFTGTATAAGVRVWRRA